MNPTVCGKEVNDADLNYCSFNYAQGYGYWGCGNHAICEAFADESCGYAEYQLSYMDCDGNNNTIKYENYLYCCKGKNCNHGISNLNISTCERKTEYGKLYEDYYNCAWRSEGAIQRAICDDDVQEITCDTVLSISQQLAECVCGAYADVYDLVSRETKQALQQFIDDLLREYSEWNDVLRCDYDLSCDLSTGTIRQMTVDPSTTSNPDNKLIHSTTDVVDVNNISGAAVRSHMKAVLLSAFIHIACHYLLV